MARPPLGIGEHGEINTSRLSPEGAVPEKWRAYCLYRGKDGKTSKPERRGEGRTAEQAQKAAIANLKKHLRELAGDNTTKLARSTRLAKAIEVFLEDNIKKRRLGTTYDEYRRWANARIIPDIGDLRLSECTPGRLQAYFDELAEKPSARTGKPLSANSRRGIRKVLSGAMKVAVRDGALTSNPVDSLEEIEGGTKRKTRGFDGATAAVFLERLDNDRVAVRFGHNLLIKFMFHTGTRVGEAIAVRWGDVNLSDTSIELDHPIFGRWVIPPRSIWINGNLVRITGQGVVRHHGKTDGSVDIIEMTPTLRAMLTAIRPVDAQPDDPVFPSATGGHRAPDATQTIVRRLRKRIGFPEFTTHFGRRTYATALDAAGHTSRQVADALRKTSIADTQSAYMVRGLANPAAASAIEQHYRPSSTNDTTAVQPAGYAVMQPLQLPPATVIDPDRGPVTRFSILGARHGNRWMFTAVPEGGTPFPELGKIWTTEETAGQAAAALAAEAWVRAELDEIGAELSTIQDMTSSYPEEQRRYSTWTIYELRQQPDGEAVA